MTKIGKALRWTTVRETFFRVAASGYVPPTLFLPSVPDARSLPGRSGELSVEIVSHCWKYHHLLAYQLSSLVLYPPSRGSVRMTVFYAPEDEATAALLAWFGKKEIPRVEWNWQALDKPYLMRRAIGRNLAARATRADWVWFTDCDVIFHEGCLDGLFEQIDGCREPLVFPRYERVTTLLDNGDPLLTAAAAAPALVRIDPEEFPIRVSPQAKGGYQITHGDVARAVGYCGPLSIYQEPSDRWRKAHEDRAFRWLLRTDGVALDIPSVYRICHSEKGRYGSNRTISWIRGAVHRAGSRLAARRAGARS
ncbi:MAG TPA: glycosyltransferase family A protein [Thermoanaerobaculia bacterium]|nr:glycosyltransferase family A protein [Thermoanaerobaculia bacterium]